MKCITSSFIDVGSVLLAVLDSRLRAINPCEFMWWSVVNIYTCILSSVVVIGEKYWKELARLLVCAVSWGTVISVSLAPCLYSFPHQPPLPATWSHSPWNKLHYWAGLTAQKNYCSFVFSSVTQSCAYYSRLMYSKFFTLTLICQIIFYCL